MSTTAPAPAVSVPEPRVREKARKPPRQGQSPWIWLAVVAIILFCLFPFYWLINVSLKTGADLSSSSLVPPNPSLKNYSSIFKNSDFTNGLKNSAIVAFSVTILALAFGSFAAYALARLKLRHKFLILGIVHSVTTFPQITIAAPLFKLWTDIGLYNTRIGRRSRRTSRRRRSSTGQRTSRPSARWSSRSPLRVWPPRASSPSSPRGTSSCWPRR